MRKFGWLGVLAIVMAAGVTTTPVGTQGSLPTRLLQQNDLAYLGSFTLPDVDDGAGQEGFAYSHGTICGGTTTSSLFVVGHDWNQRLAEINIPSIGGTATVRQPFADAFEGQISQVDPGDENGHKVGGCYIAGDKLVLTAYSYYDSEGNGSRSHFVRPVNLATKGQVVGAFRVGANTGLPVGLLAGYVGRIPAAWQSALGGDLFTGQCCVSILYRTSAGPSLFSASQASVLGGGSPAASPLVYYYPDEATYQTLGGYDLGARFSLQHAYGITTDIKSAVFPDGTASVLFIGDQGTGTACYGTGSECGDPTFDDQGGHAYPYTSMVWAYNANDFAAVKAGSKQPWEVKPYAVFPLPNLAGREVGGATLVGDKLYVSENNVQSLGWKMRIHVYSISGAGSQPNPPDTTAPSVNLTAPAASASVAGMATLTATASDNVGVSSVWFTVDGATVGTEDASAPYTMSWNSASVGNGSHVVRAMARDAAGNTASSSTRTITVSNTAPDTTKPVVTVTAPGLNSVLTGTVTLSATASDNVGVTSVQFTVDGTNIGAADTTAPYSISWASTGLANGLHTIRAVARDAAGNTTTSTGIAVTITNLVPDLAGPSVSVTAPGAGSTVSGSVALTATANDNVGVAGVQFTVDGVAVGAEDTSAPFATNWNTASATNGSHVVRAVARDAAGNKTTSSPVSVTVSNGSVPPPSGDKTKPEVRITAPSAGETESGLVVVTAWARDNVGVRDVTFYRDGRVIARVSGSGTYRAYWYTSSHDNGSHEVWAVARDAAGNSATSERVRFSIRNRRSY